MPLPLIDTQLMAECCDLQEQGSPAAEKTDEHGQELSHRALLPPYSGPVKAQRIILRQESLFPNDLVERTGHRAFRRLHNDRCEGSWFRRVQVVLVSPRTEM